MYKAGASCVNSGNLTTRAVAGNEHTPVGRSRSGSFHCRRARAVSSDQLQGATLARHAGESHRSFCSSFFSCFRACTGTEYRDGESVRALHDLHEIVLPQQQHSETGESARILSGDYVELVAIEENRPRSGANPLESRIHRDPPGAAATPLPVLAPRQTDNTGGPPLSSVNTPSQWEYYNDPDWNLLPPGPLIEQTYSTTPSTLTITTQRNINLRVSDADGKGDTTVIADKEAVIQNGHLQLDAIGDVRISIARNPVTIALRSIAGDISIGSSDGALLVEGKVEALRGNVQVFVKRSSVYVDIKEGDLDKRKFNPRPFPRVSAQGVSMAKLQLDVHCRNGRTEVNYQQ